VKKKARTKLTRAVPIITGLFWITVAICVLLVWRQADGILYLVRGVIFALPAFFGLHSLKIGLFDSQERIERLTRGEPVIFSFNRKLKLKKLLKELQVDITAEAAKFSGTVQSSITPYYGEPNQGVLMLGSLGFFLHALDRLSFRPNNEALRETVFDPSVRELSRLFAKMAGALNPKLAATAEDDTLNYVERRGSEYWEAAGLLGSGPEDRSSALWLAACTIAADVGNPRQAAPVLIIQNGLLRGLSALKFPERVSRLVAVGKALSLRYRESD
jgi:hypothetical protein